MLHGKRATAIHSFTVTNRWFVFCIFAQFNSLTLQKADSKSCESVHTEHRNTKRICVNLCVQVSQVRGAVRPPTHTPWYVGSCLSRCLVIG